MEQLIELLQQIQELAGVGIDALNEATAGGGEGEGEGITRRRTARSGGDALAFALSGPPPGDAPAEEPPAK